MSNPENKQQRNARLDASDATLTNASRRGTIEHGGHAAQVNAAGARIDKEITGKVG